MTAGSRPRQPGPPRTASPFAPGRRPAAGAGAAGGTDGARGVVAPLIAIPVGDAPMGVATAPGGKAYVTVCAGAGRGTVTVLDTRTGAVLTAGIPVGDRPQTAAVAPNGKVYVANAGSDSVTVIDSGTDRVLVAGIPVGRHPAGAAVAPNGRVYITNAGSASVTVIDSGSDRVVNAGIAVGRCPLGLAVTPDGKVYVANAGSDSVTVIDAGTDLVLNAGIPVGRRPEAVAVAPNGKAYVTVFDDAAVTVIDTDADLVVNRGVAAGSGPLGVAVAPDGRAYVANTASGTVTVIDTDTDTIINPGIAVLRCPMWLAAAPCGAVYASYPPCGAVGVVPLPPTLGGISPAEGTARGGTLVTLTGTGLAGASVLIGGAPATELCCDTAGTRLTATTAPGSPGAAAVAVSTARGRAELPDAFSYTGDRTELIAAPALVRLLPTPRMRCAYLTATLTDLDTGEPLGGRPVTFTAGKTVLGTATTGSGGAAVCATRRALLPILREGGYRAAFAGDRAHRPATARAAFVTC